MADTDGRTCNILRFTCEKLWRNKRNWLEHFSLEKKIFFDSEVACPGVYTEIPASTSTKAYELKQGLWIACIVCMFNLIRLNVKRKLDLEHLYLPVTLKYSSHFGVIREMIYFLKLTLYC